MNPFARALIGTHVSLFRLTGGRFGSWGGKLLLLTTTGRKTGKTRTVPLRYIRDEAGHPVVTASMGGQPMDPAWFNNIKSNPELTYELDGRPVKARGEVAPPDVREKLWAKLTAVAPGFIGYQKKTTRIIPMVVLKPVG